MFREKQKIAPREGRQTGCLRAKTVRGVYPNQQAERLPLPLVDNHIIPRNACRVSRGCAGLEYREWLDTIWNITLWLWCYFCPLKSLLNPVKSAGVHPTTPANLHGLTARFTRPEWVFLTGDNNTVNTSREQRTVIHSIITPIGCFGLVGLFQPVQHRP